MADQRHGGTGVNPVARLIRLMRFEVGISCILLAVAFKRELVRRRAYYGNRHAQH